MARTETFDGVNGGQRRRTIDKTKRSMTCYSVCKPRLSKWNVAIKHISEHASDWKMLGILFSHETHHSLTDVNGRQ